MDSTHVDSSKLTFHIARSLCVLERLYTVQQVVERCAENEYGLIA